MKFICDSCQQRYTIDDAKVQGRLLKVRCRRCRHLITVYAPAHPADAQTRSGSSAPLGPALSSPGRHDRLPLGKVNYEKLEEIAWHYSMGGQSFGPFPEDALIARMLTWEITDEAYVWNAGMSGWVPAFDVPLFAPAIAEGKRRTEKPTPPPIPKTALKAAEPAATPQAPPQPVEPAEDTSSAASLEESSEARDWWVDSCDHEVPETHVEKAFFDAPTALPSASPEDQDLLAESEIEGIGLVSSDFFAVYEPDQEEVVLWSSESVAAQATGRTEKASRRLPGADATIERPREPSATTRNLFRELRKADRSRRNKRWLAIGVAAAVVVGLLLILPNALGPDDERFALRSAGPVESIPAGEPTAPIDPIEIELIQVATAIREARSAIRSSTLSSLVKSDEVSLSPSVETFFALESAEPVSSGYPHLLQDPVPLEQLSAASRSSRIGSRQSSPNHRETSGESRYSRLQNGRSVPVPLESPSTTTAEVEQTSSSMVDANYFRDNLPRVRRDVQRCYELQLREVSEPIQQRIELLLTVSPDGRVAVTLDRNLSGTIFDRCLRTRFSTWRFRTFEGEAVTLRLPFTLQ
ncbi:MAG: zinc-ribbon domain-containing protein [Bradymonadales bacterium]|nr:zinc-ribbon domain-containing protein [Bradymonadales bacterium]